MKKKLWLTLAMLALCAGMFVLTASAAREYRKEGNYTYIVENGEATIVGATLQNGDVILPSTLGGYPVVAIEDGFANEDSMTSIVIPEGVRYVGVGVFDDCEALNSIFFPRSIEYIDDDMFVLGDLSFTVHGYRGTVAEAYANKKGFRFVDSREILASGYCGGEGDGNNLTWTLYDDGELVISGTGAMKNWLGSSSVPWYSYRTSIKTVTIGDSVTTIGTRAFYSCSALTSVTIPDSVTTIGGWAFYGCYALTSVTIPDSVTTIGDYAFYYCYALRSVTIGDSVTTIGNGVFYECDALTTVTIPDGVTTIGNGVFYDCSALTSVTIPDSVTTIGENAFSDCYKLTSITVAAGNINYSSDDGVLFNKDKTTLIKCPEGNTDTLYTIPDSVTTIGNRAFEDCDVLTSVTIPDSVTTIGDDAFCSCNALTSVTIPDSVTTIGNGAFSSCTKLNSITVAAGNVNYSSDDGVLFNKDKTTLVQYPAGKTDTSYTIPDSVTTIGEWAFDFCNALTSVMIPDSVTTIGKEAFVFCSKLTTVTIPDSVTTIGVQAFAYCSKLTTVTILAKNATFGTDVFSNPHASFTIHGYAGSTAETYAKNNNHPFVALASHVCDFTYATETDAAHPHAVYGICECGEEQMTAASSDDATCTICRPVQNMLASMTLGNELAINFFFYTSELGSAKDYTAVITKYNGDGTTTEITIPYAEWTPNSTKYMKITFNGIPAKEMADKLEVKIFNGNGQLVSKVFEDSIRSYIMRKLVSWSGDDAVWAVEALNYGAASQLYFGYNTDDLANADLTDAQRALAPEMIDMPDISQNSMATLVLKENILLKLWFKRTSGADTTGMYATVSYTDHNGKAVSYKVTELDVSNKNYVIVPIDTIVAADGNTAVTVTLYNADGSAYGTMVDSVISYASRKAANDELFEAVARFCTASYNYFH